MAYDSLVKSDINPKDLNKTGLDSQKYYCKHIKH